jgi:hypothetical protein
VLSGSSRDQPVRSALDPILGVIDGFHDETTCCPCGIGIAWTIFVPDDPRHVDCSAASSRLLPGRGPGHGEPGDPVDSLRRVWK